MENSRLQNTKVYQNAGDWNNHLVNLNGLKWTWASRYRELYIKRLTKTSFRSYHKLFSIWCCKLSWKFVFSKPGGMEPAAQIHTILRCFSSSVNIWRMPVIALKIVIQLFLWTRNMHYSITVFWHLQNHVAIIILNVSLTPHKQLTLSRQHIFFIKLWQ